MRMLLSRIADLCGLRFGRSGLIIEDESIDVRFNKLPDIICSWVEDYIEVPESDILDFGCGEGITALSFATKHCAKSVVGVDIMPDPLRCLDQARRHLNMVALPSNLQLQQIAPGTDFFVGAKFDLIYSWSVFEHVDQTILFSTLGQLKEKLKRGGLFFLQIAPLFYSAEGSHLYQKIPEAWGHLYNQENLYYAKLCSACSTQEEIDALWSCYQTLNRLTADRLVDLIQNVGFRVVRKHVTEDSCTPRQELLSVFNRQVLMTNQVVLLLTH